MGKARGKSSLTPSPRLRRAGIKKNKEVKTIKNFISMLFVDIPIAHTVMTETKSHFNNLL
jgi:hypothetical protein